MPTNKLASFRYRILNDCFRNIGNPYWTLNELIEHVSEKLVENFDINRENPKNFQISKRTIQADLAILRADAPKGFGAKIGVKNGSYFYEDKNFSIHQSKLSETDISSLHEAALLLKQFKGLPHFDLLEQTLLHIECWADMENFQPIVQFEESKYEGMSWIKPIYQAIQRKKAIQIVYALFNSKETERKTIHPYFLKEFRNRWYVFGWDETLKTISNAALDRIQEVTAWEMKPLLPYPVGFSPSTFFEHSIGVTVFKEATVETIQFSVSPETAPYLITKPLHHSQKEIGKDGDYHIFELRAIVNYELKAELRRLGAALEVLAPLSLRTELKEEFESLVKLYKK